MKTLKKDGINEKLLLETLAYIETHPAEWKQNTWRCGTGMCFAGHAAITLTKSKPVIPMTGVVRRTINKWLGGSRLGPKERKVADFWDEHSDSLLAKRNESAETDLDPLTGKQFSYVSIQERAENLLGRAAVFPGTGNLFAGSNRLHKIRTHIADVLEISLAELAERTDKIARRKGWAK